MRHARLTRSAGSTMRKLDPLPGFAVHVDLATVALHHVLDDGQPQPVPPVSRERLPSTR
jgi:hypothetical protein